MPKEIPDCPKKPNPTPETAWHFEIELITPMVGGGASVGAIDLDFPIRSTAIRGHLRHWWRLIRGHSLGDGMRQREEEIFGSTEFPSPVTVSIKPPNQPMKFKPAKDSSFKRFGPQAYALFASIENNHFVAKEGARFCLTVQSTSDGDLCRRRTAQNEQRKKAKKGALPESISSIATEVYEAVVAWVAFGGIGGRTRRGCGAIRCQGMVESIPQVPARIFVGSAQKTAIAAWEESLIAYRDFRQTPRGKIHQKMIQTGNGKKIISVPGRSHWPEADSIRKITGCSLKPPKGTLSSGVPVDEDTHDHSTPVVPSNLLPAFPKAVLGLPINFHFADGPKKGNAAANLDPKDVQLYPLLTTANGRIEKAERMASPIITRPIWRESEWHPAVVILKQELPEGFQIRLEGRHAALSGNLSYDLPLTSVINNPLGALAPMRGKASAIDALIKFLGSRNFVEVSQ